MRVAAVVTRTEAGGAQVHLRDLLLTLSGCVRPIVVSGAQDGPGWLGGELKRLGLGLSLVPSLVQPIRPIRDLRAFSELRRLLRHLQPDLLHCHSSKAGALGRLAARSLRIPSLFTAHGFAFTPGAPPGRRLLGWAVEWVGALCGDGIITVSEHDRALALRYKLCKPDRLWTVHNGVPDVSERSKPEASPVRMVMVARFAPPKDHRLLIQCLSRFRRLDWRCSFVGSGPTEPMCRRLAHDLGLADRLDFLGTREDVPQILADHQIFVLTSRWEGLPLSVLEAMRAGLPVVASDVGGTREAVLDGETGFLIPRGDVVTLQDRLMRLITDPELRLRMGRAGRRRYEQYFTLEQMVEKTWEVYRKVLARYGKTLPPWQTLRASSCVSSSPRHASRIG
ncbi:MAG: glycosyltransferase family 4 protein [Verrucomicrobiota bacterium]|nr:glycosyltransferase family 4 protein [Verrucomicrobiota bacterium]